MKIVSTYFNSQIEIGQGETFLLVIENQRLFKTLLEDIHKQVNGEEGDIVISKNNVPVSVSKNIDVIENFAPFDINGKAFISKIVSLMETVAVDAEHFVKTSQLLADIENYIVDLSFDFPFDVECTKLNVSSLIKSLSVCVADDNVDDIETILDYMSLVTDVDKQKLFVTVNMRSYFDDESMYAFVNAVARKQLRVLMLESSMRDKIQNVSGLIIDKDLCEI